MDSIFFWLSKLLWLLVSPLNLLLLLLLVCWLLMYMQAWQLAKTLLGALVLLLFLLAVLPLGAWLLYPLETRFQTNPPLADNIEGIVVLSGSIYPELSQRWQQSEVNDAVDRELAFIKLSKRYPDARLVYTGGSSSLLDQQIKAADIAAILLADMDIDTDTIIFERQARNTYENAVFSFKEVQPELRGEWILITSAFHMPRSIGSFCQAGWPMIPYPVDHRTDGRLSFGFSFNLSSRINSLNLALHEWLGLLAYRLSGKTPALLPQQCQPPATSTD